MVVVVQVCPTCRQRHVIRKGKTRAGVQLYHCLNTACAHPYFRGRYYAPRFKTHAEYVAAWRRRKQEYRKVYHRHTRTEVSTPWAVFREYDQEFHFTLDVCATAANAKCVRYFTPDMDGLAHDWGDEICWMNPPYGPQIGLWMAKAYRSSLAGATVVALVPSRTGTRWWHDWVQEKAEVRLRKGRITFEGERNPAGFDSVAVIYRPFLV